MVLRVNQKAQAEGLHCVRATGARVQSRHQDCVSDSRVFPEGYTSP